MGTSEVQKHPIGYGIGGAGVEVSDMGLNVRMGGRCVGGVRIASTGASPIFVVINARISGAAFTDDYRMVPIKFTPQYLNTASGYLNQDYKANFPYSAGAWISYTPNADPSVVTNFDSRKINYPRETTQAPNLVRLQTKSSNWNSGAAALVINLSDSQIITPYIDTISTTDALVIYPKGYDQNLDTYSMFPAYEFAIVGRDSDKSIIIDAGDYTPADLKTAPFTDAELSSTALVLREFASTCHDNRFYWFSRARARTLGFPLQPGQYVDLNSDPGIPQIFGIAAITKTGQTGAISVLQTKF